MVSKKREPLRTSLNKSIPMNKKSTKPANEIMKSKHYQSFDYIGISILLILIVITILTCPISFQISEVTLHHVFYYSWITAISTGLGVIPFYFISEPDKYWMGISNAIAGGMMTAASYSLAYEGSTYVDDDWMNLRLSSFGRTGLGFISGIIFIIVTKYFLDRFENISIGDMDRASAQRMILIVFVMTLHSLTEGIGIGVSFGGSSGVQLGQFISLSLAVHNIPEGLAVALVLTSKKVSKLRSGLWAVFTSLPQPLMAIPAFIFVKMFIPYLPVGLGFASGAMAYVAIFELAVEAIEDTSILTTGIVSTIALTGMMVVQDLVKAL